MTTRVGIVTFPGSNDDRDAANAVRYLGGDPVRLWHADADLQGVDAVVLPGGFSYGDYLRTGALARFAPALQSVRDFARDGGPVLGICNGFQILCESHLLSGALIRNESVKFVCKWINVRVESRATPLTADVQIGEVLQIPIKHGEGQFIADEIELRRIEDEGLVVLRYCTPDGDIDDNANPNGSADNIAGLRSERGNVIGMMPHPEHAVDPDLGPIGGAVLIASLLENAIVGAAS